MSVAPENNRVKAGRIYFFLVLMVVLFGLFAARLVYLQGILGPEYQLQADNNRSQVVSLPASRGVIYDRNNTLLARNMPSYNITITPANLPDDQAEIQAIYRKLSQLTGVPIRVPGSVSSQECAPGRGIEDLVNEWIGLAPYSAVKIQCDADASVALTIQEQAADMPGVGVDVAPVRNYPNGSITSQIIGYLGRIPPSRSDEFQSLGYSLDRDKIGYSGLEAYMQEELAGQYGSEHFEVDAAGKAIRLLEPPTQPVPGMNLRLTIDARLQEAATVILQQQMDATRAKKPEFLRSPMTTGVVIAMNPQTGEILAMVSLPTYNNEKFTHGIPATYYTDLANDISNPLLNHAISGTYPPGSVFKLATAVGALDTGVVTPDTTVQCNGSIEVIQKYYPDDPGQPLQFFCWNRAGHGTVNFLLGVEQSCDVYFYNLGGGFAGGPVPPPGLGITRIKQYAQALGYGQPLGIELFGEQAGVIPDETWKRIYKGENWATGDTYISTIGQGYVEVTPLQVLESVASIANGGRVMKPTLIHEFLDGEGNILRPFQPVILRDLTDADIHETEFDLQIQPWVLDLTREGMREVVAKGTAADYARIDNIPSAGKTGTAEYCDDIARNRGLCKRGQWPTHAWYAAYAPPDNPEIAVVAFIYDGGEGAITAGPVVRDVLKSYYQLKAIDAANRR
jgi:penicillin-binding protein 2